MMMPSVVVRVSRTRARAIRENAQQGSHSSAAYHSSWGRGLAARRSPARIGPSSAIRMLSTVSTPL